jgi:tetratricopeptide (TPR) repeat protein
MIPSLVIASIGASIVGFAALMATGVPQSVSSYDEAIKAYRTGRIEEAIDAAYELSTGKDFDKFLYRWIDKSNTDEQTAELRAAFLLHTEVVFVTWRAILTGEAPRSLVPLNTQTRRLRRLHDAVVSLHDRSPFLRTWYLLWEAFAQGNDPHRTPLDDLYISTATRVFPGDAELLLSAASCLEMRWWGSFDNQQRHPTGASGDEARLLRLARDLLRKSVAADGSRAEAHLRLGRVLMLVGDFEGAVGELRRLRDVADDRTAKYLAGLFLGEVYERQGDLAAADAEFQAAAKLLPFAQSAWLASAHVAHVRGQRKSAAEAVIRTMSDHSDRSDPWWWYIRGQWGQFDRLLGTARKSIQATP